MVLLPHMAVMEVVRVVVLAVAFIVGQQIQNRR